MTAPAWTTRERDIVLDGIQRGQTSMDISARLDNRSPGAVNAFCLFMRRLGDMAFVGRKRGRRQKCSRERVARMRSEGMTQAAIGRALGVSRVAVWRILKSV